MATQQEITQMAEETGNTINPMDMYGVAATPKEELIANIKQQKRDLSETRKMMKAASQTQGQIDLTPIASLIDAWTGSKFAQSYQPGYTEQDKGKIMMAYNKLLGDQTKQLTSTEVALLKGDHPSVSSEKAMTKEQIDALTFGKRAENANKIMNQVIIGGEYDPTSAGQYYRGSRIMPEIAKGEGQKKLEQAQRDFVNAVLRRESGAAISASEFSSAEQQYFPAVGDTPAIIDQKDRNRDMFIRAMRVGSGEKNWSKLEAPSIPSTSSSSLSAQAGTLPTPRQISPQDAEALNWLRENPNDPMAPAVKEKLAQVGAL